MLSTHVVIFALCFITNSEIFYVQLFSIFYWQNVAVAPRFHWILASLEVDYCIQSYCKNLHND